MSDKNFNEVLDYGLESKLISKYSLEYLISAGLGIIFIFGLSTYLFLASLVPPYIDLSIFPIALIVASIGLFILFQLINSEKLIFKTSHITIKPRFLGRIKKFEVIGYRFKKGDKFSNKAEEREDKIYIKLSEKNYKVIGSNSFSNFYLIKQYIEKNYKNIGQEAVKPHLVSTNGDFLGCLVPLIILSIFFLWAFVKRNTPENEIDVVSFVNITLDQSPRIVGSKYSKEYLISCSEYPDFNFYISGLRYHACALNLANNLNRTNQVLLKIEEETFQSKLLRIKEPDFWTKHFNWNRIEVLDLIFNGKSAIDKSKFPKREEGISGIGFLVAGMFFVLLTMLGILMKYTLP